MDEKDVRAEGEDASEEDAADRESGPAAADAQAEPDAAETPKDEAPAPPSDWQDLDGYCEQLRADHAQWSERVSAVSMQLASLRPALVGIAAQQRALGIQDDLERLNEAVLGGAAVTQTLRLGYGLERYLALFWPAALDPRPSLAEAAGDGEYRVEVYLHVGQDGQGRIRVEGAKRLEAPLPTSRARLRGVLLSAIQNPKLVPAGGAPDAETASAPPAEDVRPAGDKPSADERPAAPRAGDADEALPAEEQVIPLGPSEEDRPAEEAGETSQSG